MDWFFMVCAYPWLTFLFGINRIKRKAINVRKTKGREQPGSDNKENTPSLLKFKPDVNQDMVAHALLVDKLVLWPLTDGNSISPLIGGEEAFPAMLKTIDEAQVSIAIATYIFDHDEAGKKFANALGRAALRGVKTYVLIDGVGEFYHFPGVTSILKKSGVKVRRFNRTFKPWRMAYLNLRNHRKIMVVDGEIGFTGGMNLRSGNYSKSLGKRSLRDLHFRLLGPVVRNLVEVFANDWFFSSGEKLEGEKWYPAPQTLEKPDANEKRGQVIARGLPDGPDEAVDSLHWVLLSALAMARKNVRIITPYFLPDRMLLNALNHAALRGVRVEILLPEKSNLRVVDWASYAQLEDIITFGCHIHMNPLPFDHSKLLVVDESWVLIGSINWDARSLRLNFEFNVECFDTDLASRMIVHFEGIKSKSKRLSHKDIRARGGLKRLRDRLFWLLSPYL
jgi:cardiolipin synthase